MSTLTAAIKAEWFKAARRLDCGKLAEVLQLHPDIVNVKLETPSRDPELYLIYDCTAVEAVARGHDMACVEDALRLLLDAGASFGRSLHFAAASGHVDVIPLLIRLGADPDGRDADGCTTLFYAKDAGVVQALLACGANVDAADRRGLTPLMAALLPRFGRDEGGIRYNYVCRYGANAAKVVTALLRAGADVNARAAGWHGFTALHFLAKVPPEDYFEDESQSFGMDEGENRRKAVLFQKKTPGSLRRRRQSRPRRAQRPQPDPGHGCDAPWQPPPCIASRPPRRDHRPPELRRLPGDGGETARVAIARRRRGRGAQAAGGGEGGHRRGARCVGRGAGDAGGGASGVGRGAGGAGGGQRWRRQQGPGGELSLLLLLSRGTDSGGGSRLMGRMIVVFACSRDLRQGFGCMFCKKVEKDDGHGDDGGDDGWDGGRS